MRALVIGSEGNIGSRLSPYLRSVGHDVFDVDLKPGWRADYLMADITHPLDLLPAFDWGPDVVYLCAALVGRMPSEQAASLAIETNLAGVNNVLQLCKRVGARCVFFSSSEVYGPTDGVMDDVAGTPRPNNRYGLTKLLGEQLVEYEVRSGGLAAVTLRPCMFYHEKETVGEHRSAMIRFAANLARRQPIQVHQGSARGWLHIDDAVRAIEAAGRVREYATINVGHPDVRPMTELAEMVRAELGASPSLISTLPLPAGMTLTKHCTLDRQRQLLGFEPRISLEEGVRRVCQQQRRALGTAPARSDERSTQASRPRRGTIADRV